MGLNAVYDAVPEEYEGLRRCWLNERRFNYVQEQIQLVGNKKNLQVLELGSGTGFFLKQLSRRFPEHQFTGIEPLVNYVEYAKQGGNNNIKFICSSAEEASKNTVGPYDNILSNDVLHHVESLEKTVASISTLCQKNTQWTAIEPNFLNPYAFLGQSLKKGEKNFFPSHFIRIMEKYGWKLLEKKYIFLIPPFIKSAPEWLKILEIKLEKIPLLGGGVVLNLIYKQDAK